MGVLRARVGGAWVDIASASDEVWVSPDAPPVGSGYELWVDTDAPSTIGSGLPTLGTVGQILTKNSSNSYDASWQTAPFASGQVVTGGGLGATITGALTRVTNDMVLPSTSSQWLVTYSALASCVANMNVFFRMYGLVSPGYFTYSIFGTTTASFTMNGIAPGGATVNVHAQATTTNVSVYGDSSNHQLFAIGMK